jgi:hypothetical protein
MAAAHHHQEMQIVEGAPVPSWVPDRMQERLDHKQPGALAHRLPDGAKDRSSVRVIPI